MALKSLKVTEYKIIDVHQPTISKHIPFFVITTKGQIIK